MTHTSAFLIIPAHVADHPDVDDASAVLFGRLNSLSNKEGYCFASNEYLASISKCQIRMIKYRLKRLQDLNLIKIFTTKNGMKWDRKIFTCNHYFLLENFNPSTPLPASSPTPPIPEDPPTPPIPEDPPTVKEKFTTSQKVPFREAKNCPSERQKIAPSPYIYKKEKNKRLNITSEHPDGDVAAVPAPSADASEIYDHFLLHLKKRFPGFKDPKKATWLQHIDRLLRLDHRPIDEVKAIIEWTYQNDFWGNAVMSPEKFREQYIRLRDLVRQHRSRFIAEENEKWLRAQQKKPQNAEWHELQNLKFCGKYVKNPRNGEDVSFNLPKESFVAAVNEMLGGEQ